MALTIVFPSPQFEERVRMEAERLGLTPEDFLTEYLNSLEEFSPEATRGADPDHIAHQ